MMTYGILEVKSSLIGSISINFGLVKKYGLNEHYNAPNTGI